MSRRAARRSAAAVLGAAGLGVGLGFFAQQPGAWVLVVLWIAGAAWIAHRVRARIAREREDELGRGLGERAADAGLTAARAEHEAAWRRGLRELRAHAAGLRGGDALPCFAVIGEPGAGKSALLRECGLDVPARHARPLLGAGSCEIVLANQAVAIEASGRWLRCAAELDRREWRSFLALLRQSRPACPLTGVLVALPVPVLLAHGPAELEEHARAVRRRLNEIRIELGVDAPVYLLATHAESLTGFAETARLLPEAWRGQALGWTSDRRRLPDPGERVASALAGLASRLAGFAPELLLRETEPLRRQRLLLFAQELEVAGRALARFAGIAFQRDRGADHAPFLRGVYFTGPAAAGGFGRELVLEIVCGDEPLALPEQRVGPRGRRALAAAAAFAALGLLGLWGLSFAQNRSGARELAELARRAGVPDPALADLRRLAQSLDAQASRAASPLQKLGFRRLDAVVERAARAYVFAFERSFDAPARAALETALADPGEPALRAAIALAADLEFVTAGRDGAAVIPDWSGYGPRAERDPASYRDAYAAYLRWLPAERRRQLARSERALLETAAARWLRLAALEKLSANPQGALPPLRYADLGLAAPGERDAAVAGIYTAEGHRWVSRLLAALARTDAAAAQELAAFRRDYAQRYDASWREFLLAAPLRAQAAPDPRASPYLKLVEQVDVRLQQRPAAADSVPPPWVAMLHILRDPSAPGWRAYEKALDAVALEIEDAAGQGERALQLARDVAEGKPSTFARALQGAAAAVPRDGDVALRAKLRALLEAPVLDGFSALLGAARRELDRRWATRVAGRYAGPLAPGRMTELYAQRTGALAEFVAGELAPFVRDGRSRALLGDRALPLGARFLAWLERAGELGRRLEALAPLREHPSVHLRGVPSAVEPGPRDGGATLRVTRRDLRLSCAQGDQTFVYREGNGEQTLRWSAGCEEVVLRVLLGGAGAESARELRHAWPSLSSFLEDGQLLAGRIREWEIAAADGTRVRVKYEVVSGGDTAYPVHRPPPPSLGS